MAAEFRVVDVWVGRFTSEATFRDYLRETYSDDEDESPISKFAEDMGETYYNHDFREAGYHGGPSSDLKTLLDGYSFASSYSAPAIAEYSRQDPGPINAVILIWGESIASPRSARGVDYELHYLGRFDSDPRA